jgi:hypothetical protein
VNGSAQTSKNHRGRSLPRRCTQVLSVRSWGLRSLDPGRPMQPRRHHQRKAKSYKRDFATGVDPVGDRPKLEQTAARRVARLQSRPSASPREVRRHALALTGRHGDACGTRMGTPRGTHAVISQFLAASGPRQINDLQANVAGAEGGRVLPPQPVHYPPRSAAGMMVSASRRCSASTCAVSRGPSAAEVITTVSRRSGTT